MAFPANTTLLER